MRFNYCPHCGKKLKDRIIGDEGNVPYCERCEKPLFDMFSSCIIVLVVNEFDEVLLLRQGYISDRYCNLVSGYMKPGESAEETAEREVFEETGVKTESLRIVGTYWFEKQGLLMLGFFARAKKCELVLSGEVDSAKWVDVRAALEMVHPSGAYSHTLVEKYINDNNLMEEK